MWGNGRGSKVVMREKVERGADLVLVPAPREMTKYGPFTKASSKREVLASVAVHEFGKNTKISACQVGSGMLRDEIRQTRLDVPERRQIYWMFRGWERQVECEVLSSHRE